MVKNKIIHENNNDLINISYVSKLLGVSKLTLRNWDKSGRLKAVRIGNRGDRRYKLKDLEKLSVENKQIEEIDKPRLMKYIKDNNFWMEEGPMLPITIDNGIIQMSNIGNHFKPGLTFCIFMAQKDYCTQILSVEESIAHCKSQFKTLKENPDKINKIMQQCKDVFIKFEKFLARLDFIDLKSLSQEEIINEFTEFNKMLSEFWSLSLLVEPYSPFLDKVYFRQFEKLISNSQKAKEAFATLTLPLDLSFVARERADFLKIIINFLQSQKERKILLETPTADYLADIKFRNKNFFTSLQEHQQKHYWIQNNYAQHTYLTIKNFLEFIKEAIYESNISKLTEELERLKNQEKLSKKQESLIKELKLSEQTIRELKHLQNVTWIKDERKKVVLMMLHHFFNFIEEFSKRADVDPKVIAYAATEEIPKIIEHNFNTSILDRRREQCFWVSYGGNKRTIFIGNDAVILRNKLIKEELSDKKDVHGNVACRGEESVITGKVKIILDPKDQSIEKDEILVTSMTRPEFVPLMRKSLAVITDEGGITCHAAIVSREMNKPCIIGTGKATRIFKTGDEVELRMNHGIVKILKK
ncbi:MerR family transcriptional regulator [Candidatus Woesearchaeota archaeon]|nr:MerR family transcriptional regulator [Candidatus Woesearchaeota archaeon]